MRLAKKLDWKGLNFTLRTEIHHVKFFTTGWGIKISHISRGHCAGCSGGREVGQVSFGRLRSTVFSTHHGFDR
jgi:hypothetical protein